MAKGAAAGHIRTDKAGQEWMGIDPYYYYDLLKKMNKIPKETQAEIRRSSFGLAQGLARAIANEGYTRAMLGTAPPQAELVAKSVKPVRDRIIKVELGGKMKVGRPFRPLATRRKLKNGKFAGPTKKAPAGALLYGSEFGSSENPKDRKGRGMGRRYILPHRPYNLSVTDNGYWVHPAWRDFVPKAWNEWLDIVNAALKENGLDG